MKTKLLLVLLVVVGLMAPTARANLLSNPSFEEGIFREKNVPDYWSMSWSSSTSAWTWFDDADAAHWGDKYIKKVSFIAYGSSAWMWQTVKVTPGQEYAFSVWAKCPVEGEQSEVWGYYEWLNSVGSVIGQGWLSYSDLVENDWEHAEFGTKTAPALATRVMYSLVGVPENGPMGVLLDDAHMGIPLPSFPSPAWEERVLIGDVDLSWTNLARNDPNTPVYVKVLFGTEPYEPEPAYDMELLVLDPVSGQDVTSVTIEDLAEGTYYWQVNSYLEGDPAIVDYDTNDPNDPNIIKGHMWSFTTTDDLPPSVTINTPAMIAWQDEPVQLDATVIDEGTSPVLIEWTALATGVTFTPNEFVADPVVSIVKGKNPNANILNPSFELRLAYWDRIGVGHGAWTGSYDGIKYINPSDGALLAYTDSLSNGGADAGLSQTMTETFAADTTYTLTVDVANDGYYEEQVSYRVQLLAGGSILAEDNNEQHELPVPTGAAKWYTSTVVYTLGGASDPNFAYVGEPLEIRLLAIDNTREMSFDNVHLTADPGFPIPPGAAYELTVTATDAAGSDSDTMTIDMYDDACQAARVGLYLGTANRGDIVSNSDSRPDCVTDIYDFAEMALKWLWDTLPTEAFVNPVQPPVDPVVNGIFDAYKPGSDSILAEFILGSYTQGVGDNLAVLGGIVIYSDGTSGDVVDCPGWVKVEGTGTNDLLNNGIGSSVGFSAFGTWSGVIGTKAISDEPVGTVSGGKIYTISAMVNGSAGPLVLELQADGVTLTPSYWVTPGSPTDGWEELSRTYDADSVAGHLGEPMKIVIGTTPPGLFGTRVIFDNVKLEIVSSDPRLPDVDAGVDMVTWSDQPVQLAPTVVNNDPNDPQGTLFYEWSASDPNNTVFSATDIEAPIVTITKEPAVPAIVPFVAHSGFEDPVLTDGDWTYTLAGWLEGWYDLVGGYPDWPSEEWGAGVTNPDAGYGYGGIAPEGENVAFVTSDAGWDDGLTQLLQNTLQAGSTYELSALVGNPSPYNFAENGSTATADYRIELVAGGVVIASTNDKGLGEGDPSPADDTYWTTASLTFTPNSSHPQLGRPLEIRLIAVDFDYGYELNFDDVQLLINGESEAIVYSHLPAVVKLTLAVTLEGYVTVFDAMAIDVYDTPCLAIIETSPDAIDPTDITADDCITNLVDFAVMAETWLDDYALTEPAEKP